MVIKAIVFDFDGLIVDTETQHYQIWSEIYQQLGCSLPLSEWGKCVGTNSNFFDVFSFLEQQLGHPVDREHLRELHQQRFIDKIPSLKPREGIVDLLNTAKVLGLKLAVASSSGCEWVKGFLERLNLASYFMTIVTREDVEVTKPAPDLFLEACSRLQIDPSEGLVFEDSYNGVTAAKRAGMRVVAVTNPTTQFMDMSGAAFHYQSFLDFSLTDLLKEFEPFPLIYRD